MNDSKKYTFDGMDLIVPLLYDSQTGMYLEDYRQWVENPVYTPNGHPVMFSGEDACTFAVSSDSGECPDCGSCRFYRRAAEHTWIGICMNEEKKSLGKKEENKYA